jgi:hypothetical protein
MAESKNVAAFRKTRQEGDPAAAAEAEGKAAKRGLELQDAESKRPGAGKSPAPGDNAKPGTVGRGGRRSATEPAGDPAAGPWRKTPDKTEIGGSHGPW